MTLPITTTEYKELISKARILKSQIDNKQMVKDFVDFTLSTAPENFDTTKLTREQIEEMFEDYLLNDEFRNYRKYEHFLNYDEDLSSEQLEEILEKANNENIETFKQATTYHIFEKYPELEWDDLQYFIDEFFKKNKDKQDEIEDVLNGEDYKILSDVFYEHIDYDLDVKTLLNHSAPDDLAVYFGTNWDDSYADMQYDFIECFNETEFLTNERNTPIDWLMSTQGYTREDLVSEEKRQNSKFLTSLYEELFDYMTDLYGCQLVAVPSSDDFESILNLTRRKNVIIKKSTMFGFFDSFNGSGCGMSIELEKDILIDENSPVYHVSLARHDSVYDYSPNAVFGLARSRFGNDLKIVETKKEEKQHA